jgi:2-methylisocitrate lyase-like PEP mutase family enzyme
VSAKTDQLRRLIDSGERFIAADTVSALTARVAQRIGFPAVYVGGHALGVVHYGVPDYGVLEPHEMIAQAGRIARSVDIPTIVDADEMGGNVASIYRCVRDYESAGVAGVHLEDESEPKHSTWRGKLLEVADMQARIATAVKARTDPNFIIIARTNELLYRKGFGTGTLEGAIERGQAAAAAGADAFIVPGITAEEVAPLVAAVPIPFASYSMLGDGTGIRMILATGWASAVAGKVAQDTARAFHESNDSRAIVGSIGFRASDVWPLMDDPIYDAVIEKWAKRIGQPTGVGAHKLPPYSWMDAMANESKGETA